MKPRDIQSILWTVSLLAASLPATATTALEKRVYSEPMPHTLLNGAAHTVQYVRLEGTYGKDFADYTLRDLRAKVDGCKKLNQRAGKPVTPPREYPDLKHSTTLDTYWAPNRTIEYRRQYVPSVNMEDCSLLEAETYTALLRSAAGRCKIDLLKKTASGMCDGAAHAAAAPRNTLAVQAASMDKDGNEARAAAMMVQMAKLSDHLGIAVPKDAATASAPGGPKKRIAGLECEQVTVSASQGTACIARRGTFDPAGIMLASKAADGSFAHEASEVALNVSVSDAVFMPHLRGGFRVTAGRP